MTTLNLQQINQILAQYGIPAIGAADATLTLENSTLNDINYDLQQAAVLASLKNSAGGNWAANSLILSYYATGTGIAVTNQDLQQLKTDTTTPGVSLQTDLKDLGTFVSDLTTVGGDLLGVGAAGISIADPKAPIVEEISGWSNLLTVTGMAGTHLGDVANFSSLAVNLAGNWAALELQPSTSNLSPTVQNALSLTDQYYNQVLNLAKGMYDGATSAATLTNFENTISPVFGSLSTAANTLLNAGEAAAPNLNITATETATGGSASVSDGTVSGQDTTNLIANANGTEVAAQITNSDGSGSIAANGSVINYDAQDSSSVNVNGNNPVVTITPNSGGGTPVAFTLSGSGITGNNTDGTTLGNITFNTDGSYTSSITNSDYVASTTYSPTGQPISGLQTYADGSYVDTEYNAFTGEPWVMQKTAYNSSGDVISTATLNTDGTTTVVTLDPANPNNQYAVTFDAQGNPLPNNAPSTLPYAQYYSAVIDTLATQLISKVLLKNDLPASLVAEAFASASIKSATGINSTGDFNSDLAASVAGIAGGLAGSEAGSLIARAIGVPTEAGSIVGGVGGNVLAQYLLADVADDIGISFLSDAAAQQVATELGISELGVQFGSSLAAAGGGVLGGYLATFIAGSSESENIGATIGGVSGAVAGAAVGTYFGGPIGGYVGEFIGSIIGSFTGGLIGGIFDPPRGTPLIVAIVGVQNGQFAGLEYGEDNNANINDAYSVSNSLTTFLNQVLANIGGTATGLTGLPAPGWSIGYGAVGNWSEPWGGPWPPNGSQIFGNMNEVIEDAAFHLLRSVQITGGNPIMMWELETSTATNVSDLVTDLGIAQDYALYSSSPLAVDITLASANDPTQYQNFQNELVQAQNLGLDRLSYDGTTMTINTTAALIAGDLATLANMPGAAYTFAFADTAANMLTVLSTLEAQGAAGHLTSVAITDTTPPTFSFSATQVGSNVNALEVLTGTFNLNVTDSAANISANLDALQKLAADNALTHVTYSDPGTPTFSISAAQLANDAGALGKLTSAVNYAITDTAASISQYFGSLVSAEQAGHLVSVETTDSGTPTLSLTVNEALNQSATLATFTTAYTIAIVDTGANIAANLATFQTMAANGSLVAITPTDATPPTISVTLAQTTSDASVLAMLAGKAVLNVTGVPTGTTTLSGTGFTVQLAANDTLQGSGTNTYISPSSGGSVAVTLSNSVASVNSSGTATYTSPLTGFGSSVLVVGTNGTSNFTLGSDHLAFQNDNLQSLSYANGQFLFGLSTAAGAPTQSVTWNPTTGQANLVVTAPGGQPVTTSLGQVNPGTTFLVAGDPTITNTNSSGQKLLSTTVNADGSQVNTVYNYSGGANVDTVTTLNVLGQETSIHWDHTDGSTYTSYVNPTTQAAIANLTVNANGSGSLSTANSQTVSFGTGNAPSVSIGNSGDTLLTFGALSGSGITETLDLSNGLIVSTINSNSVSYALPSAGASVDAAGNVTLTSGGTSLYLPVNGANATFTDGSDVLSFPQDVLQSVSLTNGAYVYGLASSASGFAETLTWNPTTGVMSLTMASSTDNTITTTPLGLFNPGNTLNISGSTISIKASNGTVLASTTINADGTQSNTFNNGAGALHTATDGTTTFVYGSDQLTFQPNTLQSATYANSVYSFSIATLSNAYTEVITWNPTTGMANLVLTATGGQPVTTTLGQINPGSVFNVSSSAISNTNSSGQELLSTTVNADGSQIGTVYNFGSGGNVDTVTTLNKAGQQTTIHWDHTDGSSYTSYTNPTTQAAIANLTVNANGSGSISTNNNQTISFTAGNKASVSIGTAGDTLLTITTASGSVETFDMSSGKIVSTVDGNALSYTLANAGASIDASGNVTLTGGGSTIVLLADGSNATFKVGSDSLSFPQNVLQSLSSVSNVYMFGVASTVTGSNETISWNPTSGMASLVLTPTAGGSSVTTAIGQINPNDVLTLSGHYLYLTGSGGAAISTMTVNSDGSLTNIVYYNANNINETVTSYNTAGQMISVRTDHTDGSTYTSYYQPGTQTILVNRSVNADGSGYVATINNQTVNVAKGNSFTLSFDASNNPIVTVTPLTGGNSATLKLTSGLITSTVNGNSLSYSLPTPTINYDGSGNLTLVAAGSTLVLPDNGSPYLFTVTGSSGTDTLSLDPASVTSITPNGAGYNYVLKPANTGISSEYVNWNPTTGVATLYTTNTSNQLTTTNMGLVNPGNVMKISSSIITNTNSSGVVMVSYAVQSNGSVLSTSSSSTYSFSNTNSPIGLASSDTATISGTGDTVYASPSDAITLTGAGNTVNTQTGGDTITVADSLLAGTTITGTGSNTLNLTGGGAVTMNGNETASAVNLAAASGAYNYTGNNLSGVTVTDSDTHADTLTLNGGSNNKISINSWSTTSTDGSAGGFASLGTNAEYNTVTLTGAASQVFDNGSHNAVILSGSDEGDTITGSTAKATLNGGGDWLELSSAASGANVWVNGTQEWITDAGSNDTYTLGISGTGVFNLTGTHDGVTANGNNSTINLQGASDWTDVYGSTDTVTDGASDINAWIDVYSADGQVTVNGAGTTTNLFGADDGVSVNTTNATVNISGVGDWQNSTGTGLTVTDNSTGTYAWMGDTAANAIYNIMGANSTVTLSGNNDKASLNASYDTANIQGTAQWEGGSGANAIVNDSAAGSGASLNDTGANGVFNISGANTAVTLSGGNDGANLWASNDTANLNGTSEWVNASGSGDVVNVTGNNNHMTFTGTNDSASFTGTGEAITASGDSITLGAGTVLAVTGNNDTITASTSSTGDTITATGTGNVYAFGSAFGPDVINNSAGSTASGTINFTSSAVTDEQLWFVKSGNNLVIDLLDTSDSITVDNWFGSSAGAQVAAINASGLKLTAASAVQSLVTAMATYQSANSGFNPATATAMPTNTALQNAITSAWHT